MQTPNLVFEDSRLGFAPLYPVGKKGWRLMTANADPFLFQKGGSAGNDGPGNIAVIGLGRNRSCGRICVDALCVHHQRDQRVSR